MVDYSSMLTSLNIMALLTNYSGPGGFNVVLFVFSFFCFTAFQDADMLLGSHQAALTLLPVHSRSQFTLWCVLATPLLIGANANMTAFDLATYSNAELIDVSQDLLGVPGSRVAGSNVTALHGGTNVWARPLADGSVAAAFFNAHELRRSDVAVSFSALGLGAGPISVRVRDLWQHKELGNFTGSSYTVRHVAPGATAALRFWKL